MSDDVETTSHAKPQTPVVATLRKRPWSHGFFVAMRRLEESQPERPRWGEARLPSDEPIRVGVSTSTAFAASEVTAFAPPAAGKPDVLRLASFGAIGPQAPMPLAFSEYVRERERRHHDPTLRAFLDVYQHRLALLWYRAWASGRGAVEAERPGRDRLFAALAATYGGLGRRDGASPYFAGRFAAGPRSPEGLEAVLSGELYTAARVTEMVGRRMRLERSERTRLRGRPTAVSHTRLGRSAVLGHSWLDPQHRFSLKLGPMGWRRFSAFLPRPPRHGRRPPPSRMTRRLYDILRAYVEPGVSYSVRVLVKSDDVTPASLSDRRVQLGCSAWLPTRRRSIAPKADLMLRPTAGAAE